LLHWVAALLPLSHATGITALSTSTDSDFDLFATTIHTAIMSDQPMEQDKYVDTAVRAVTNKRPVPEIDFTLHTMEDGTQVSTMERVCKGMYFVPGCCSILL
jgi:hypothetical protein